MATPRAVHTAGSLQIHVGPLESSDLIRDYQGAAPALAPFFSGHPFDPAAYERKADEVRQRLPASARRAAGEAIRATSAAAGDRLARILEGDGFFVTTGQQAGLFGGPFYTVHKILTAIQLARHLEALLHIPVAPLFWVAADDHDWAEVNHTFTVTPQNELKRVELTEAQGTAPHAMSHRLLDDSVTVALAEFCATLPNAEFTPALEALVEAAYRPGRSVAQAFEELLAGLFAGHDLLLVNPAHPAVKQGAAPVLRRELEHTALHADLLARQSARLESAGYHAQVTIAADAANVFLHDEQGRERLVREDGSWLLRRTRRRVSDAELLDMLARDPASFSPNVLLRPVVESSLFPTLAYVGGPAEVGYFGQIGCLFAAHGVMAPVVFPRFGVMLIEAKVRKVLDKFGMAPVDFARPFHEVAARLVREEMPGSVHEALATLRDSLMSGYERLGRAAEEIDPTLRGWLDGQRNQALSQTDSAAKKIASHLRKRSEVELEQLRKAALNLYPDGTPQERVLNPLPFLARYGASLLDEILERMQPRIETPAQSWIGVQC